MIKNDKVERRGWPSFHPQKSQLDELQSFFNCPTWSSQARNVLIDYFLHALKLKDHLKGFSGTLQLPRDSRRLQTWRGRKHTCRRSPCCCFRDIWGAAAHRRSLSGGHKCPGDDHGTRWAQGTGAWSARGTGACWARGTGAWIPRDDHHLPNIKIGEGQKQLNQRWRNEKVASIPWKQTKHHKLS